MTDQVMSLDRMDEIMRAVFLELKAMGGSANGSDVLAAVAPKLKLTDHERAQTRTGAVRWDTHTRFYTSDCVRAGWLTKSNGIWTLTAAGEQALSLPRGRLIRTAGQLARVDRKEDGNTEDNETASVNRQAIYEQVSEQARKEIDAHIEQLSPYDFQNLVAALLQAMGYHVPYVAPPGPDGGIDIVAYKDPLGTDGPRIKVQVKHRVTKVDVKEVRELEGLLRKEGDVGLIVSSGGFTSEAMREIRSSTRHIEMMDQSRLISLWQENYAKVAEISKSLLPLVQVYLLAPDQE